MAMPKRRVEVEFLQDRDAPVGRASPLGKPVCVGNHSLYYYFYLSLLCREMVGLFPNRSRAGGELGGLRFTFHNLCDLINSAVC